MSDKIEPNVIVSGELYTPGAKQTVEVTLNWAEGTVSFFDHSQNEYVISGNNYDFTCLKRGWIFTDYRCSHRSKPRVYKLVFFNWDGSKVKKLLDLQSRRDERNSFSNRARLEQLLTATDTHFVIAELQKAQTEAELASIIDHMDVAAHIDLKAVMEAAHARLAEIENAEKRPFRIVHIDDEEWLLEMVGHTIRASESFSNVTLQTFRNRDDAWRELLLKDPDLLITDLRSDNIPGRPHNFGMSGFQLLSLLAKRNVNYPILVFSGSLSIQRDENEAIKCAGENLNFSFLKKPATSKQLLSELSKHLHLTNFSSSKKPNERDTLDDIKSQSSLTNEQQAYIHGVFARAGKPSVELQRQIDEIRAIKTQDELTKWLLRDAKISRPKIEAELLCAVICAKQSEINPSINAKNSEKSKSW